MSVAHFETAVPTSSPSPREVASVGSKGDGDGGQDHQKKLWRFGEKIKQCRAGGDAGADHSHGRKREYRRQVILDRSEDLLRIDLRELVETSIELGGKV